MNTFNRNVLACLVAFGGCLIWAICAIFIDEIFVYPSITCWLIGMYHTYRAAKAHEYTLFNIFQDED